MLERTQRYMSPYASSRRALPLHALLQDHTGWEIVDWTTIDPTFPPAPRQQKGDSVNCAIIVTLIMELRLVNEEVTFNKFPISKMELFHVRKRLIYNLNRFDTARIFYHVKNNKK